MAHRGGPHVQAMLAAASAEEAAAEEPVAGLKGAQIVALIENRAKEASRGRVACS